MRQVVTLAQLQEYATKGYRFCLIYHAVKGQPMAIPLDAEGFIQSMHSVGNLPPVVAYGAEVIVYAWANYESVHIMNVLVEAPVAAVATEA